MEPTTFREVEYEHGCRCACCGLLFEEGDELVYREIGDGFVMPTCWLCERDRVGLPAVGDVVLCADGSAKVSTAPAKMETLASGPLDNLIRRLR